MEIYKLSDFEKGSKNHKQGRKRGLPNKDHGGVGDGGHKYGARCNGWVGNDGGNGHDDVGRCYGNSGGDFLDYDNCGGGEYVSGRYARSGYAGDGHVGDGRGGDDGLGVANAEWENESVNNASNRKDCGTLGTAGDACGRKFFGDGQLRVTDIRQAQKNLNRVNVFINERYAFSLDVAQVVELGVKVGKVLTAEELAECRKASEFGKAYQRALEWALIRPRSVRELRDYLTRRAWRSEVEQRKKEWQREREIAELVANGEDIDAEKMRKKAERSKMHDEIRQKYDFADLIVERLTSKGYVDDLRFAEYYVENRFVKKGISRKRLETELMKKGIDKSIIERVIGARSDEAEIKKIIAKKYHKYDELKLIQYLCRQGFDYQLVQNLVRDYGKD